MISVGKQLTILPSVDSTNNYAMARVRAGLATNGEAWFALEQTAGRGQWSRQWHAQPGQNIMVSIALQPLWLLVSRQFLLSAAVSLACHDFFAAHAGDETKIKWPNDLYWRDRKAGGILIENIVQSGSGVQRSELGVRSRDRGDRQHRPGVAAEIPEEPDRAASNPEVPESVLAVTDSRLPTHNSQLTTPYWSWSVIGIGININQTSFPESSGKPVSLKQITGKDWDLVQLVQELCGHIGLRCHQLEQHPALPPEYNHHLYKRGETTRLKKGNRVFDARINGVNDHGQLLVTNSMEEVFNFGEVEWVG